MARLTGTIKMRIAGSNSIDFLQKQGAMEKQGIPCKNSQKMLVYGKFI